MCWETGFERRKLGLRDSARAKSNRKEEILTAKEFRSFSSSSTRRQSLISFSEGGVFVGRVLVDPDASSYIWSVLVINGICVLRLHTSYSGSVGGGLVNKSFYEIAAWMSHDFGGGNSLSSSRSRSSKSSSIMKC